MFRLNRFVFPVACLISVVACSGDPAAVRAQKIASGDRFVAQKKIPQAIIEYRGAVQADPLSGEARRKLADTYLQSGDIVKAIPEYVRAADLLPDDVAVQLKAGGGLLQAAQFLDAKSRAENVLRLDPSNYEGLILMANALAGLNDMPGAIVQVNRAIKNSPTKELGYNVLGSLQLRGRDLVAAEQTFKQAIANNPKSVDARLSLASLYYESGRRHEAQKVITEALAISPQSVNANRALAQLYINLGQLEKAEEPLKVVAASDPEPRGKFLLADYYLSSDKVQLARETLNVLAQRPEAEIEAKVKLAAITSRAGDRAGAMKLYEEVLAKSSTEVEALIGKSQLQSEQGNRTEALATLRAAVQSNQGSARAHYTLGRTLELAGQGDEAVSAYRDALKADPQFGPAAVSLGGVALREGGSSDAIEFAKIAIRSPTVAESFEAHTLLARAQIASGELAGAEKTLGILRTNFSQGPQIQAEVGLLLSAKGDAAGARRAFTEALSINPRQMNALEGLTALELRERKFDAARALWRSVVAANPNDAVLQFGAARAFAAAGDDAEAERLAKRALELDPNSLDAYSLLAQIYYRQNKLTEAGDEFTKLAQLRPRSAGPVTAAAMMLQVQNKVDQAVAGYERALQIDPKAAVAANNLAQIYADRNEKLDEAMQLAQIAKAALPNSHEVSDTLGWVYYKKDFTSRAIAAFQDSVAAKPDNPSYHYHLGLAYLKGGQTDKGRASLREALRLKPDFPEAGEATRALAGR